MRTYADDKQPPVVLLLAHESLDVLALCVLLGKRLAGERDCGAEDSDQGETEGQGTLTDTGAHGWTWTGGAEVDGVDEVDLVDGKDIRGGVRGES